MVSAKSLLPVFLAVATAFRVPVGAKDGVYKIIFDADGNEVHQPVSQPRSMIRGLHRENVLPLGSRASAPDPNQNFCDCATTLDTDDTNAAVADLVSQVYQEDTDEVTELDNNYYSVRGDVVAFICLLDDVYYANQETVNLATTYISDYCGSFVAGTYQMVHGCIPNDYDCYADIGYMDKDNDLCSVAEDYDEYVC